MISEIVTASLKSWYNDESLPSSIKILKPVYNQICFCCMCFMGTFKKTEYDLICKAFTGVFSIAKIPHSTVLTHFSEKEKAIL